MRTIKFRAWDKEDNRMIVDEQDFIPLKVTNKGVLRLSPLHVENLWSIVNGERCEVMQFTGLTDKNGKEIYEGDIVEAIGMSPGKVIFENGTFRFDNGSCSIVEDMDHYSGFEVVGNIYEKN